MSIRLRLIFALMASGIAAVLAVGVVSYYQLQHRFEAEHAKRETERFVRALQHYLEAHGDGPAAPAMREFLAEFVDIEGLGSADVAAGARRSASGAARPRVLRLGGARGAGAAAEFRFVLTDANYHVLLGAGRYTEGSVLPPAARDALRGVTAKGAIAAYVATEGVPAPGADDLLYLRIMNEALIYGGAAAALLALGIGVMLGQGLSGDLRRLRAAVEGMSEGALRQEVALRGSHEVRALASAFNAMSQKLARSDEVLRASHQTISEQALKLKELSIRDPLTGLYNRRHFDDHMRLLFDQSRRHGRPLALAVIDLDRFKLINDSYSHATGDEVLKRTAALLRARLRASDLLARWGGEEFVIALPETSLHEAVALCEALRERVAGAAWHELDARLSATISIGVCDDTGHESPQAMFAQADERLYRAKEGGRNRVAA